MNAGNCKEADDHAARRRPRSSATGSARQGARQATGERAGVVVLEWVEPPGVVILTMAVVGGMLGLVVSLMITHHLVPQLRWLK